MNAAGLIWDALDHKLSLDLSPCSPPARMQPIGSHMCLCYAALSWCDWAACRGLCPQPTIAPWQLYVSVVGAGQSRPTAFGEVLTAMQQSGLVTGGHAVATDEPGDVTLRAVRYCLAALHRPVILAINATASWRKALGPLLALPPAGQADPVLYGHAVLCDGCNDADATLSILNSEGPSWGNQGRIKMTYDRAARDLSAAYVLDLGGKS